MELLLLLLILQQSLLFDAAVPPLARSQRVDAPAVGTQSALLSQCDGIGCGGIRAAAHGSRTVTSERSAALLARLARTARTRTSLSEQQYETEDAM